MRAGAVVVVGISPEHAAQMRLAKNNQMVQTFSSDRSDQALDMSILPRRPRRYGAIPDAHCPDPSPEYLSVGAIPISDDVSQGKASEIWRAIQSAVGLAVTAI